MKKLKLLIIPLIAACIMAFTYISHPEGEKGTLKITDRLETKPFFKSYKPIYIYPSGDKFSGSYTKIQGPVTYTNLHDTVITGKWFYGDASQNKPNLTCKSCYNVIFRNNLIGQPFYIGNQNDGIQLQNSKNITIQNCYFESVSTGVHAFTSQTVKVDSNQAKNMMGPTPLGGDFAQMNRIYGPGNSVSYNRIESFNFIGHQEDAINLYACNGVPTSPIRVIGNKIRGGGPSTSGSGITVGDGPDDGVTKSSYQLIFANTVVNSGYAGIQISGGTHIQAQQNYIFSSATPYSHIGLNFLNFHGYPATNITISGNYVNWMSGLPTDLVKGQPQRRDIAIHTPLPNGTITPLGWTTNITGNTAVARHIDASLLPTQLLTTANPIH